MDNIISCIRQKEAFVSLQGAERQEIEDAERKLNVEFTMEYREYVSEFGAVSYYGHELTGVCKAPEADVVNITFDERKFLKGIPSNWYVIEQMHIDGIVVWQSEDGTIYRTAPNTEPVKLCDSLMEYIARF